MSNIRLESLHFYPVKSCAPVSVPELALEERGPIRDREWMVVDTNGKFVTQRDLPAMALVRPSIEGDALLLQAPSGSVSFTPSRKHPRMVEIWGGKVEAFEEPEGSAFFSSLFARELFMVRIGDAGRSLTGRNVRFADSYPLHLCSLESLADLNARLSAPVEILRFRPNIVVSGAEAFAEDTWKSIRIGEWDFAIGKACTRCSITTVDPVSAERGPEPLQTLAKYRRVGTKVEFGQYLLSAAGAVLRVGMRVEAF